SGGRETVEWQRAISRHKNQRSYPFRTPSICGIAIRYHGCPSITPVAHQLNSTKVVSSQRIGLARMLPRFWSDPIPGNRITRTPIRTCDPRRRTALQKKRPSFGGRKNGRSEPGREDIITSCPRCSYFCDRGLSRCCCVRLDFAFILIPHDDARHSRAPSRCLACFGMKCLSVP